MVTQVFAERAYEEKKRALQREVILRTLNHRAIALKKNTSNLFRSRKQLQNCIDVRAFNKVLSVNREHMEAVVEGMCSYERIVAATMQYYCLPTVVPELKSITIGGALSGVGIESSSFRYGLVHETIIEFDVLLGDGRVVTCRPDNEYRDLFYAFPNSYGTLGYALRVKIKLVPVKSYIRLTHLKFENPIDFFSTMKEKCLVNHHRGDVAYIDGTIFTENEMYITLGEFVEEVPFVSNYKYMNIYYRSIQKKQKDYLTTLDYIWRWDPDWFWCSKVFYMQNPVVRFLFGKTMLKSTVYWKLKEIVNHNFFLRTVMKKLAYPTESIIQDVAIPIENTTRFLEFFHKNIGIKPIWTCPIIPYNSEVQYGLFKMKPDQLYVNFGFWDMVKTNQTQGYYNRLVEKKVMELNGMKSLYSNVYFSEEEFWHIYNWDLYSNLKRKYDSKNVLNDLYQKCTEKNH